MYNKEEADKRKDEFLSIESLIRKAFVLSNLILDIKVQCMDDGKRKDSPSSSERHAFLLQNHTVVEARTPEELESLAESTREALKIAHYPFIKEYLLEASKQIKELSDKLS